MPISLLKKVILLFFCFAVLPINAIADDNSAKLKDLSTQITKVKTDLTQKKQEHSSVKQQLAKLTTKIITLEKSCKTTAKNLKEKKASLAKLTKDLWKQQQSLQEAQNELSQQINLAYQVKCPSKIKTFFGKKERITSRLLMDYHKCVFTERIKQMENINWTLVLIERSQKKIKRQTKELESLESKQKKEKEELTKTKKQREELLNSLKTKIDLQDKKLKKLLLAKKNLEDLIKNLPVESGVGISRVARTQICKNFVWPAHGVIVTRFGSPIEHSAWKWNGVVIRTKPDQKVKAGFSGKVIYAGLLTGYGLLLIIDHGNGYISLYGYNSSLHAKLNSNVKAGDVVATVGKGDSEEPELYFAIRYNGKPIDPEKLC